MNLSSTTRRSSPGPTPRGHSCLSECRATLCTFLVDAARSTTAGGYDVVTAHVVGGGGERPRYKFIFVPELSRTDSAHRPTRAFTKSDVTQRRYPDIFLAFFVPFPRSRGLSFPDDCALIPFGDTYDRVGQKSRGLKISSHSRTDVCKVLSFTVLF